MEYLPDVYPRFERAFPHVHSAHQDLAKACYEGGPLDEWDGPARQARNRRRRTGGGSRPLACAPRAHRGREP
jgi:hypothetical protein